MISATRHKFTIHTDDLSQPYCTVCECILFTPFPCPCPSGPNGCKKKNPCQKVEFLIRSIHDHESFLFLDNDLLIMKSQFLDHMQHRSQAHDFLASYAHLNVSTATFYRTMSSGLMYIRRLLNVNYNLIRTLLYKSRQEQDQGVVTRFFQTTYSNWDSLSWKWHCRALKRSNQDVPTESCYTIHDRHEADDLLRVLNRTRLTIPTITHSEDANRTSL